MDDDEDGIDGTELFDITVHAGEDVGNSFTDGDDNTEQFLGSHHEGTVILETVINVDDLRTSKQLHNKSRSHDGADTEFHKSSSVGCEDNSHPVEGISGAAALNSIERNLATEQEDKEGNDGPHGFLTKGNLLVIGRRLDLREDHHHGLN